MGIISVLSWFRFRFHLALKLPSGSMSPVRSCDRPRLLGRVIGLTRSTTIVIQ